MSRWISGSVGDEQPIGLARANFCRTQIVRDHFDVAAALSKVAIDVVLRTAIERYHFEGSPAVRLSAQCPLAQAFAP